tara:strand:+ start:60 stop:350 length:291 start_codon:yes stop_codon:yes gene_type:complete
MSNKPNALIKLATLFCTAGNILTVGPSEDASVEQKALHSNADYTVGLSALAMIGGALMIGLGPAGLAVAGLSLLIASSFGIAVGVNRKLDAALSPA